MPVVAALYLPNSPLHVVSILLNSWLYYIVWQDSHIAASVVHSRVNEQHVSWVASSRVIVGLLSRSSYYWANYELCLPPSEPYFYLICFSVSIDGSSNFLYSGLHEYKFAIR